MQSREGFMAKGKRTQEPVLCRVHRVTRRSLRSSGNKSPPLCSESPPVHSNVWAGGLRHLKWTPGLTSVVCFRPLTGKEMIHGFNILRK